MEKKTDKYLISVYDIDNFVQIAKQLSTSELFNLMKDIQDLVVKSVVKC